MTESYSGRVSLEMHVSGEVLGVAKVGPDRITLENGRVLPAGRAVLVVKVGNSARTQRVTLEEGQADGTVRYSGGW